MPKLLVVPFVAIALTGIAIAQGPAQKAPPAEVWSAGQGVGTAKRTQTVVAKVRAVDVAARILTVENGQGGVQSIQVDPAVKRLKDVSPGDTITATLEQVLRLEYQPEGTAPAMAKMKPIETRGSAESPPSGTLGSELRVQVKVVKNDWVNRIVTFQDERGQSFQVKAGPNVDVAKIKAGQQFLATYIETLAVKVDKFIQ